MSGWRASGNRGAALPWRAQAGGTTRKPVLTLALALSTLALAEAQRHAVVSYVRVGNTAQPAFAWCDAPDRVLAVTHPSGSLVTPQPATLLTWPKRNSSQVKRQSVTLGTPDPGAGNIYTPLTFPGAGSGDGQRLYYIHSSNVENPIDPHYRMQEVGPFRLPQGDFDCRYVPQAEFVGATSRRTVIVWHSGHRVTYATRNFDGTAGVFIQGGQPGPDLLARRGGDVASFARSYSWNAPDGYSYRLEASEGGGTLTVLKGGQVIQSEPFLAYSVSLPTPEQP